MKNVTFYRVQDFNGSSPFLFNSQLKLHDLYMQIQQKMNHQDCIIYYNFTPYSDQKYGTIKMKQIVARQPMQSPIFYIYDYINDSNVCPITQKYGQGLDAIQKSQQDPKKYSIGQNGHVIFDCRNTSLLASAIDHASSMQGTLEQKKQIISAFNTSIIEQDQIKPLQQQQTFIRRVLSKIGIGKKGSSSALIKKTIQTIKNIKTKQDLLKHIDNSYSDYDLKFATYLQGIYLKYAILNQYKLHYIQYKTLQQGIINYKFPSHAKIAIIGDFGTGLSDSIDLLRDIIIDKQADIILHLGDVYYAGTPNQYKYHVMEPLNKLRKEAAGKFQKDVLFYSIPGNHDYYSWGLPFLCFIANVNEVKEVTGHIIPGKPIKQQNEEDDPKSNQTKQETSYFCLQSQDRKWQFIGLDTAYHDSNPMNQVNCLSLGPRLRQKEVEWFVDKMEKFPGSTILLTHHQLFSIYSRICGTMSKCHAFSCINPLLSAQLFKYLPSISCWFWGHEHSIMFFGDNVMGIKKCRLLGNSSFHVFSKQAPYLRKKGFPFIPLIEQDQKYVQKYLPLSPQSQRKNPDTYFNLSYAIIDFSNQKPKIQQNNAYSSTLPVQYYCCPCYPQSQNKKKHFTPYLLYKQQIQPRIYSNIKLQSDQHHKIQGILQGTDLCIKTEIGLFADRGTKLTLTGLKYQFSIYHSVNDKFATQSWDSLQNNSEDLGNQTPKKQKPQQQTSQLQNSDKKGELLKMTLQDKTVKKYLLDGDIIKFNQVKPIRKLIISDQKKRRQGLSSSPNKSPTKKEDNKDQQNGGKQNDLLGKLPKLKVTLSLQQEMQEKQFSQVSSEGAFELNILEHRKLEIRKHRILKDQSVFIKFGDAFSLKDPQNSQYLSCQINIHGGRLKLAKLKPKQHPCLFMFITDSKVSLSPQ